MIPPCWFSYIKFPINFDELDKCLIDVSLKRSEIRKLFNIEDDTIVFFIDLDAENFYEVEYRHSYANDIISRRKNTLKGLIQFYRTS